MARRELLRSAVAKSWRFRSVPSAETRSPIPRKWGSDATSAAIACSSTSFAVSQLRLFNSSRFLPSSTRPSSRSVSGLLHSISLSSSLASAAGVARFPPYVCSFLISGPSVAALSGYSGGLHRSLGDLALGNVRGVAAAKSRGASLAPWTSMQQRRSLSKLKKYKMKPYSSYKERFKLMADGTFKRWRSGTRHNAHSKTAKQRRQLRRPSIAPAALATVMKKLNFVR